MSTEGTITPTLDEVLARFESAWSAGTRPALADYLFPPGHPQRGELLVELVHIDLAHRIGAGDDGGRVEDYVERYPEELSEGETLLPLIALEFEQRWRQFPAVTRAEYLERFLQYGEALRSRLRTRWLCPDCRRECEVADEAAETVHCPSCRLPYPLRGSIHGAVTLAVLPSASTSESGPSVPGYEILRELGRGGMGVVYEARETALGRKVAIKTLRAGADAEPAELERFEKEVNAVARLQHPNIVPIFAVGQHNHLHYFSMELLAGTLEKRIAGTPLPPLDAARLVETLARAMHVVHQVNIIHRDLKPANVLLTADGTPKVTDFGLAKHLTDAIGQTQSGQLLGTPSYMAPEQAAGRNRDVGPRTDVYALGAILYECLTGRPPFKAATLMDTLTQVIHNEPAPPRQLNPKVPRDLETVCATCLRKEPSRRYSSTEALAEDLRRFCDGRTITARPTSRLERAVKWARRNPSAAALIALGVVTALGVITGLVIYNRQMQGMIETRDRAIGSRDQAIGVRDQALAQEQLAKEEAIRQRDDRDTSWQREMLRQAAAVLHGPERALANVSLGQIPQSRWGWECDQYVLERELRPRCQRILGTHDSAILALLASPDHKQFVSAGADGQLLLWDDGKTVPTVLIEGVWLPDQLRFFPGPRGPGKNRDAVTALAWVEPGRTFVAGSLNGQVTLWDVRKRQSVVLADVKPASPLNAVAVSADRKRVLCGDQTGAVHGVNLNATDPKRLAPTRESPVVGLVAGPKGGWYVAHADGTIALLDADGGGRRSTRQAAPALGGLALSPDGQALALAGRHLTVWEVGPNGDLTPTPASYLSPETPTPDPPVFQLVQFGPGDRLLAADSHGRLFIWVGGQRSPEVLLQAVSGQVVSFGERSPLPFRRKVTTILPGPDGRTLVTATQDTTIKEWRLHSGTGRTELDLGPLTCLRFDHADPVLVWVGRPNGRLDLCDSDSGAVRGSVQAHKDAVTDLAWDPTTGPVSAGEDGQIRCWKRTGTEITPHGQTIAHDRPLRSLSVHSDRLQGQPRCRIVAADEHHQLLLWDGASGKLLEGPVSLKGGAEVAMLAGLVAFNADGSCIAAAGPADLFRLFAGGIEGEPYVPPNVVSGTAAALVWHPTHPHLVVAGDSAGRIHCPIAFAADPRFQVFQVASDRPPTAALRSLAFSPDGRRLATLRQDGTVQLFDPRWVGQVWLERSTIADPLSITFDPTGHRLAVAHANGKTTVWETYRQYPHSVPASPAWTETVLLAGSEARSVTLPARHCAALREDGRLDVLLSRLEAATPADLPRRVLRLGTHEGDRFRLSKPLEQWTDLNRGNDIAHRATALCEADGALKVFWRRIGKGNAGQMVSFDVANGQETVLGDMGNAGFDLHVFSPQPGRLVATHFDHDGHYLRWTRTDNGVPDAVVLGRQGDGFRHKAVLGRNGRLHLVFNPLRFGGDPSAPVYLTVDSRKPEAMTREVIDASASWLNPEILLTPTGEPMILFQEMTVEGTSSLVVARRGEKGWKRFVALDRLAPSVASLAVHMDGTGRIHVLLADDLDRKAMLASGTFADENAVPWKCSTLRQWPLDGEKWSPFGKLMLGSGDRLSVLFGRRSERYGFLSLFTRE